MVINLAFIFMRSLVKPSHLPGWNLFKPLIHVNFLRNGTYFIRFVTTCVGTWGRNRLDNFLRSCDKLAIPFSAIVYILHEASTSYQTTWLLLDKKKIDLETGENFCSKCVRFYIVDNFEINQQWKQNMQAPHKKTRHDIQCLGWFHRSSSELEQNSKLLYAC